MIEKSSWVIVSIDVEVGDILTYVWRIVIEWLLFKAIVQLYHDENKLHLRFTNKYKITKISRGG